MTPISGFQAASAETSTLLVILNSYHGSQARMEGVRALALERIGPSDVYAPTLPTHLLSTAAPEDIVRKIILDIDEIVLWQERERSAPYGKIIFVGHSLGGLLARQTYRVACGQIPDVPAHPSYADLMGDGGPRSWAHSVERIVLLAGMNRGWSVSHHLSIARMIGWSFGSLLAVTLEAFGRTPLILTIKRGAPFITRLRVEWILMRRFAKRNGCGDALTVQLLGSIDDMVSPEDNIDLISGEDFIYLDVPYSGHDNVINTLDKTLLPAGNSDLPSDLGSVGAARAHVIGQAFTGTKEELGQIALYPADVPPALKDPSVTDVVFVIHGIRDEGYWTHKIARKILRAAKRKGGNIRIATETSSYGYFPMLPFILPFRRRSRVQWLMNEYAEALALYPKAKFSFVGHSNGTYLLSRALQDYSFCRFKNVAFAGSVVDPEYSWNSLKKDNRVGEVLNFVSSGDWVVALFPKTIKTLRWQDLGGAGHDGFEELGDSGNVRFVRGGHSAALSESNWDAIAEFILTGRRQQLPGEIMTNGRSWWAVLCGTFGPIIWAAIIGALIAVGVGLHVGIENERLETLILVAYIGVIWAIVTRI